METKNTYDEREQTIIKFFNAVRADNLIVLDSFYDKNVKFIDPISKYNSLEEIKSYYAHMYKNVIDIRFDFHSFTRAQDEYIGTWTMYLKSKKLENGKELQTEGVSHFRFDPKTNKVIFHRDYFDMHEFIYRHIPMVGYITRKVNESLSNH